MNFIANESAQKLRGGYYTPNELAEFLASWVLQASPTSILEPSCGDGSFIAALESCGATASAKITGFDIDPVEAAIAGRRAIEAGLDASINSSDFLLWSLEAMQRGNIRFDAVVGNPPFIRYQYLPSEFQERSEQIFQHLNQKFTKHTNAWVPFLLASFALLRPGGRMAMVVPSEILHIPHAQAIRSYLGSHARRLVIIDPEEIWFSGTLQGAVILMAEKLRENEVHEGLGIIPVRGREFLRHDPQQLFSSLPVVPTKASEGKWTRALLDEQTRNLLDEMGARSGVSRFADIADVNVGIVTGANKFFLVPDDVVDKYELQKWAHPMFGRSEHCPGVIYDADQHAENASSGHPTNFLWFESEILKTDKKTRSYIKLGEMEDLHNRYKCRIRKPWYKVPSVYTSEIGMLKRSHDTPRLIHNRVGAFTTDTAYRITALEHKAADLVACFVNPLTGLTAELEGRHYGGGVLELVPSEIERLLVPDPTGCGKLLSDLDHSIRSRTTADVLSTHGAKILKGVGISRDVNEHLVEAWRKMRNRRHRVSQDDKTRD